MKAKVLIAGIAVLGLSITHQLLVGGPLTPEPALDSEATSRGNDQNDIVIARGTLDCANYVDVRSPFKAKIRYLIPEGVVKKGDLLVELHSPETEMLLHKQEVLREQAGARIVRAKRQHDRVEQEFRTGIQAQEGQLRLAELALEKYLGEAANTKLSCKLRRVKPRSPRNA